MGMNATMHAKDTAVTRDGDPTWQPSKQTSGAVHTYAASLAAGEDQTLDRTFGGARADYASSTADALLKTGAGVFYGCTVNAALSAATVTIRDSTTAGGGTIIATLPASSAIGYTFSLGGVGINFTTGLYIDFGGTGTVTTVFL